MKRIFTMFVYFLIAAYASAQVTFTAEDMPVPKGKDFTILTINQNNVPNPVPAANQQYDFSKAEVLSNSINSFIEEISPFYTNAGIDVYIDLQKKFSANFYYNISQEWDFDATGIYDKGHYVYPQSYGLSAITGNDKDSLIMPEQGLILNDPRVVIKFPFTANTAWKSSSRRYTDFTLSVAALNFNKVPCRHVYTTYRQDSIVGWGKVRIPTETGTSQYYDVLIERVKSSIVDSFYINGQAAPSQILNFFSVKQGQKLDESHLYNIYRKGQTNYFVRVSYGTDATYKNPNGLFVNTTDTELSATEENASLFTSVIFPCPASTSVNILLNDQITVFNDYLVFDLAGRVVSSGNANQQGNMITIPVQDLTNGNYVIQLSNGKQVHSESIIVQH